MGSKFVVKTDNTGVSHFFTQLNLTTKQARWQEFLAEFDFAFEHRADRTNQVANTLSRRAELVALRLLANMSASTVTTPIRDRIRENLDKDPMAQNLIKLAN